MKTLALGGRRGGRIEIATERKQNGLGNETNGFPLDRRGSAVVVNAKASLYAHARVCLSYVNSIG